MSADQDQWQWSWYGPGNPDKKAGRGRVYYKGVEAFRKTDNMKRIYNVGDTVNMIGEEHQVWTAQLVDLFQVKPDDEDLRRIIRHDSRRATGDARYEYMRCTLRWFYNPEDMKQETLRRSSVPKQVRNEIYFSDHVEISGFNSITVIDGMAWVFPSKHDRDRWLREPDVRYRPVLDIIRIVRTFVNSASPDLTVREMDTGELEYHLKNPTSEKNLFETGRQRMRGKFSAGSIVRPSMKTLGSSSGKRRKRVPRAPINIADDDDDDSDYDDSVPLDRVAKKKEPKLEDRVENVIRSKDRQRKEKRRKVIVEDDDDDDDADVDRVEPVIENVPDPMDTVESSDLVAKQRAELEAAQSEVLDMVTELNMSAANFDPNNAFAAGDPLGNGGLAPLPFDSTLASKSDPAAATTPSVSESQRKKPSSPPLRRASSAAAPVASSSMFQKRPSSLGALQRRSSASSGLKKTVHKAHVIVLDGDNDSNNEPQRMLPSITPRRTRIREVSIGDQPQTKQRVPFMSSVRDRKATADNRGCQSQGRQHEPAKSKRPSSEVEATRGSDKIRPQEPAIGGRRERRMVGNVESEVQKKKLARSRAATAGGTTRDAPGKATREVELVKADARTSETDGESGIDWWKETRKVLQTLKNEFQSMTPACQQLFRNHFDTVFDLAVKKVTSNGLFGKIESNDDHLSSVVREIVGDLGEMILKDGGEGARNLGRLGVGPGANVDTLEGARGIV